MAKTLLLPIAVLLSVLNLDCCAGDEAGLDKNKDISLLELCVVTQYAVFG